MAFVTFPIFNPTVWRLAAATLLACFVGRLHIYIGSDLAKGGLGRPHRLSGGGSLSGGRPSQVAASQIESIVRVASSRGGTLAAGAARARRAQVLMAGAAPVDLQPMSDPLRALRHGALGPRAADRLRVQRLAQ